MTSSPLELHSVAARCLLEPGADAKCVTWSSLDRPDELIVEATMSSAGFIQEVNALCKNRKLIGDRIRHASVDLL